MSNVTVQEALKAAQKVICEGIYSDDGMDGDDGQKALLAIDAALAEIDKCEPVAYAIRERDRLGFAVVNVIGKLDEIIEKTQEVEIDDFLHIAVPVDMWNELQDALEDMPKRADLYTSPQPIEKCEPVYQVFSYHSGGWAEVNKQQYDDVAEIGKRILFKSPQPRDWVGLSDDAINYLWFVSSNDIEGVKLGHTTQEHYFAALLSEKLKQLNTKG